jgi:HK97 family phage major capsid protein
MTWIEKAQRRGELVRQMRALHTKAAETRRELTADEGAEFDRLDLEQGRLAEEIRTEQPTFAGRVFSGRDGLDALEHDLRSHTTDSGRRPEIRGEYAAGPSDDEVRVLAPRERMFDYIASRARLPEGIRAEQLSLGRAVRAIARGEWRGAEAERRAMGTSTVGAGGAITLPGVLSGRVIDLARSRARVIQAGALTVPMETQELAYARLASAPTASWKAENAAGDVSDASFERLTLRARTLMALVKMSVELAEDAINGASAIEQAMAAALALKLDYAALRGGASGEGSIMPLGVRATPGVNTIAVNAVLGGFDYFSRAVEAIQTANGPEDGLAVILSTRESGSIDRMKDGEGQPIKGPASWERMGKYPTTQIPVNLGGGTNESEAYVGDWSQLVIGMRTELQIEASRVAADTSSSAMRNLQVWLRAYLRADVLVTRETWFTVLTGIKPQ